MLVQLVLVDPDDPGYRELIGPPVRKESAEMAVELFERAIEDHRDKLSLCITPVPEFGPSVCAR